MKTNAGFATVDFLFAIIIAFSLVVIVFSLTFTLSVVEVAQYVVFSAARAQSAGNLDPEAQEKAARAKYEKLVNHPVLRTVFRGRFFDISDSKKLEVKSGLNINGNFDQDYPASGYVNRPVFQGVRTELLAKILELKIPFFGTITNDDDGFRTKVVAIILREPSMKECTDFMKQRMEELWRADGGRAAEFRSSGKRPVVAWEDNGC